RRLGENVECAPAEQCSSRGGRERADGGGRSRAAQFSRWGGGRPTAVGIACASARVSPAASGRFDTTSAISAGYERSFAASISAAILEPRPEIRTATRFLAMRSPVKDRDIRDRRRRHPHARRRRATAPSAGRRYRDAGLGVSEACLRHGAPFVCSRASVLGNPRLCNGLIAAILILAWPHVRLPMVTARRAGRAGAQI